MSVSALFRLAREYLWVGAVLTIFIGILFLIGYFMIYKKLLKGKKVLKARQVVIWAIFLIYIIALFLLKLPLSFF